MKIEHILSMYEKNVNDLCQLYYCVREKLGISFKWKRRTKYLDVGEK